MSIQSIENYVFTLDNEAKTYAEKTLNETDQTRDSSINEIRKWLEENPYLHAKTDSVSILAFLRGSKFNMDKTKLKLKNYYEMRRDRPEWFTNRNPLLQEIEQLVKLGVFTPLKKLHENRLVIIIRTAAHDPKIHKIDDVFKTGKMILDVAALENEYAQIYGVTAVFDMRGVGFRHARQLTPHVIKNAVFAWQNYHCRPKQLEFINAPLYINVVLNVFKSYMSEKLKGRVRVHFGAMGDDVVDKEILPPEYGGQGDSMEVLTSYWHEKLLNYKEWFAEDEMYKAENLLV